MRIAFAGTPEFARQALDALIAAGHQVVCVLTQPDRPSGRGMKLVPSPVKQAALDADIPVLQPRSLRLDGKYPEDARAAETALRDLTPEVMVVAAYGLILPQWVLDLPRHGCLNIHASLHDGLAADGARTIVDVLVRLEAGDVPTPVPQPAAGVCYADKLLKSESALDFFRPAAELARRVRAFDPFPGTTMALPGFDQPVKVWGAQAMPAGAATPDPGVIVGMGPDGIDVATADGVLRVTALQKPGGRRQPVAEFMRSYRG